MATVRAFGSIRQFSSSSARASLIKAPIQLFGTEGRYAHALYSAASKQKQLDKVAQEMDTLQGLLKSDVQLADFVKNPTVQRKMKKDAVVNALTKLKYSDLTLNVVSAMGENGRLNMMSGILKAFGKIMSAHRGEVAVTVTTAKPLEAAPRKELETVIKSFLKKTDVLLLEMKVDPSLIGGMTVNIQDERFVDMSISKKLNTYTALIKQAV